jgi:hypothetical protein
VSKDEHALHKRRADRDDEEKEWPEKKFGKQPQEGSDGLLRSGRRSVRGLLLLLVRIGLLEVGEVLVVGVTALLLAALAAEAACKKNKIAKQTKRTNELSAIGAFRLHK